jgi:Flp pilus assembly protein TadG
MGTRKLRRNRSGAVAVLALCLMIVMLGVIALAVDIGYMVYVDTELQRTADAAAIAATWKLVELRGTAQPLDSTALADIRSAAGRYAGLNRVANATISLTSDDTCIGQLPYPFSANSNLSFDDPTRFNAVKVRVRKTSSQNGSVALFFARVLGVSTCDMEREAMAAFIDSPKGIRVPYNNENVQMLPFALDSDTWGKLKRGEVTEANLYPDSTSLPAGNRGTVDIGSPNNSTADISRQIRYGVSPSDLAYLGGTLALNDAGVLYLNGDTGISAGVKDDLASIIGKPRIIPIFSQVSGPGNNATYTITDFGGIRITSVKLTGSPANKKVMIQLAENVSRGLIPSSTSSASNFVYSPVWLVR